MNDYVPDAEFGKNLYLVWFLLTSFYGGLAWLWVKEYRPNKVDNYYWWLTLKVWFFFGYSMTIVSLL